MFMRSRPREALGAATRPAFGILPMSPPVPEQSGFRYAVQGSLVTGDIQLLTLAPADAVPE